MVLNGSTILLPQFLENDLGYTAKLAGMALSPGGTALAVMMPIAGILATKFDPRAIIAIGFALTSFGLFHVTNIYFGISFDTPCHLSHHPGDWHPAHLYPHQHAELCRRTAREV
jgi:DHA2 family multidrug resistance protein